MRYLKPFLESIDKEAIKIEDMLVRFTDTGELTSYDVDSGHDMISIFLNFNKTLSYGYKTVELCSKIVDILKNRYKYIYCENTCLCIDLSPRPNKVYITEPILDTVNNIFKNHLKNLNVYTSDEHTEYYFFGKESSKILFQYDINGQKVYAMFQPMWKDLENYVFADNINKALIIRYYIRKYVKIQISSMWNRGWSVPKLKLNYKCKANELH